LGIPARVVKGYRGLQPLEPGHYLIRQSQAHSWVEALIEEEAAEAWLTLDPTPSTERTGLPLLSWFGWLLERWSEGDNLWRTYVIEYNADGQASALSLLRNRLMPENPAALAGVLGGVVFLLAAGYAAARLRRRWRRVAKAPAELSAQELAAQGLGFYPRL